jgi:hypothetical protein
MRVSHGTRNHEQHVHDTTESPEAPVELGKLDREGEYEDYIYRIGYSLKNPGGDGTVGAIPDLRRS